MAPELAEGREYLSPAADMFAFGVLAYTLLCGDRPFIEPPFLAAMGHRKVLAPQPLEAHARGSTPAVAELVTACMAIDRSARPRAEAAAMCLDEACVPVGAAAVSTRATLQPTQSADYS